MGEFLVEHAHEDRDETSDQLRAEYGGEVEAAAQGYEQRNVREARAHNDRKTGADVLAHRKQLDKRRDCRDEQRRLDQDNPVRFRQTRDSRNDDGRRDAADDHRDDMLE